MTKFVISSTEPVVVIAIAVPLRLLPQLATLIVAAADAGSPKPCVETTHAEPAPASSSPELAKVRPISSTKLRRVG